MKKEKIAALKKEFPFLTEILNKTGFDPSVGNIRIARVDSSFLRTIPKNYYWSGVAGRHSILERLFVVKGDDVKEVPLVYETEDVTAGGYARYFREGQTILSSLIEKGFIAPDFLVFYRSERITYNSDQDSDDVTIYKPMKGATISQAWADALREAELKIREEIMSVDDLNARLQNSI